MHSNRIFKMFLNSIKKAKQKPKACQMFRHIFDGKFYSICQTGLKIRITYEPDDDQDDDDDDDNDDDGFHEGGGLISCVSQHVNMPKKGNIYMTNYAFNQTNKLIYSFCLYCKFQNENFPFYLTCKMKEKAANFY